jgi:hypothetical protein
VNKIQISSNFRGAREKKNETEAKKWQRSNEISVVMTSFGWGEKKSKLRFNVTAAD